MIKTRGGLLRTVATRAVIAVIPAAMVSAYASGLFISPPRIASYEFTPVAEITADPTTVGIAASNLYGMSAADINAQLDQMQAIGVQNIRVFVPWGLVEYADDSYNWQYIDAVVSAAAARNMGVMAEINGTPVWDNPSFPPGAGTPDPDKFADFMKTLISRTIPGGASYANTISAYEIWNEPNGVLSSNPIDPVAYAHLLERSVLHHQGPRSNLNFRRRVGPRLHRQRLHHGSGRVRPGDAGRRRGRFVRRVVVPPLRRNRAFLRRGHQRSVGH